MTVDHKKATRWMNKEIAGLENSIQREKSEGFLEQNHEWIRSYASGEGNIGRATVALTSLAGYAGATGSLAVIQGEDGGFAEIDRSCLYNYWVIRLLVGGYRADQRPGKHPRTTMDNLACCWMHAAAIGAREPLDWLTTLVKDLDQGDPSVGGKDMNPLCGLMAHFATGHDRDSDDCRVGVDHRARADRRDRIDSP
jgi:hypothetical protein